MSLIASSSNRLWELNVGMTLGYLEFVVGFVVTLGSWLVCVVRGSTGFLPGLGALCEGRL